MRSVEVLTQFSSRSPRRTALLAVVGGAIGASQVVLGLLLGAGGPRFAIAFIILGGLTLAASTRLGRQWVRTVVRLVIHAGLPALGLIVGEAAGFLIVGRAHAGVVPGLWLAVVSLLSAALIGAGAGIAAGANLSARRTFVYLGLGAAAGLVLGAALGRMFSLATAKFTLWGVLSGVAVSTALGGLLWGWHSDRVGAPTAGRGMEALLLFVVFYFVLFSSCLPQAWDDSGRLSLYTLQARSLLAGRLDVDVPFEGDLARFEGKEYLPFQPLPTLIPLPFVWLEGNDGSPIPMSAISAALAALSAVLLKGNLERLQGRDSLHYWILAAFVFGTGYWMAARGTDGGSSNLGQVVAVLCLLLAIRESLGARRGLLTGLFLGMAFLSRPLTLLASLFLLANLLTDRGRPARSAKALNLLWFCAALAVCVSAALVFNYVRYHNPLETGYLYQVRVGFNAERFDRYGLVSPAYIPNNAYFTFLHGFNIEFRPPLLLEPVETDSFGTSLTVASPFLFLALWARGKRPLVWGAWCSIGLTLLGHLMWMSNGRAQVNTQRFMLDYLPMLILLVSLGAPRVKPGVLKGMVLWAIGLNLLVVAFLPWMR